MIIDPFADNTDYEPLKLKPKEPLRIIKKPYKEGMTGRKQWAIPLSNGKVVNLKELAKILGIKQQSMFSRFHTLDWDDPELMATGRRRKKQKSRIAPDLSHIEKGKYSGLSGRPR